MSSLTVRDYHIGWICALEDEMAAAMAMVDEEHPMIAGQDRQDHNSYVLGRIHQHNVVIACMPAGIDGLVPAATVAKDMARTFPELRVGLMVGIGGGIPNLAQGVDVRLGDVVVSMPDKIWGGVVQYDHGKAEEGGVIRIKGQLNQPPDFLLRTLAQVQARHRMRPSRMAEYIAEAVAKNSMLEDNGFVRPEAADELMCPACGNRVEDTAGSCDGWHQQRQQRKSLTSVIHHGIIASGNMVVKDAVMRDQLRDHFSALCVEMEAAGLMNDFPCLVIRGICDYADRHKNDRWHAYAAMTAAAYAKEFLSYVSPAQANQVKPIRETVQEIVDLAWDLRQDSQAQTHALQAQTNYWQDDKHQRCHQAFKPTGSYEEQKDRNPDRVDGTCQWVLMHELYRRWRDSGGHNLLWISADPGCGKSVLAKSLVDCELRGSSGHSVCYFFFKDNEEQDSVATALCAILHQLLAQQPQLIRHALAIYDPNKPEKVQQDVAQLWQTLLAAAGDANAQDVTCVLDALDECRPQDQSRLIEMLARFYEAAQRQLSTAHTVRLKFLVTSRPYDDIKHIFHRNLRDLPSIRLQGEHKSDQITQEINLVIRKRVVQLAEDLGLRFEVTEQLQNKLLQIEHRTYLWLHLAIESIYTAYRSSFAPEEEAVDPLPRTVEDAYEKILNRIQEDQRSKARKILQIIVGSRRALTVVEMAVGLGIAYRRSAGVQRASQARLDPAWVGGNLRHWCGLFVFFNHKRIYLIHQTAKEFLLADARVFDPPSGWKHCLDKSGTEAVLARICTDFLRFQDVQSSAQNLIRRLDRYKQLESVLTQDDEVETLLVYAAEHWPSHFHAAQSVVNDGYVDELTVFYDSAGGLQHLWFPIYWRAVNQYEELPRVNSLQLAGLLGHAKLVARMLQPTSLYGINDIDRNGHTALIWASRYGHTAAAQILLDKGADVNAQGGRFSNALQAASQEGHEVVVQMLLNKGADVNAQGGRFSNALQAASLRGHGVVVQMLLDKGADVNARGGKYGTALQAAVISGQRQVAQTLVDAGAYTDPHSAHSESVLRAAANGFSAGVINRLLASGADGYKIETHSLARISGGEGWIYLRRNRHSGLWEVRP